MTQNERKQNSRVIALVGAMRSSNQRQTKEFTRDHGSGGTLNKDSSNITLISSLVDSTVRHL